MCMTVEQAVVEAASMFVSMDDVIANSFRDYHVKGFDYICLGRSPEVTTKLYFFDGDLSKLPEVVNPHDHRYDFLTVCLAGRVENQSFKPVALCPDKPSEVYQRFAYRTPLNGGDGFTWTGESRLVKDRVQAYGPWMHYASEAAALHTIRIAEPETILMLQQFSDVVEPGVATVCFTPDREPPALSGLYNTFTPDQIVARLAQLNRATGLTVILD